MTEHERQPAGWYKDPWDAAPARWWDGENWSDHTGSPERGITFTVTRDIPTSTVWIWLLALIPLVQLAVILTDDPMNGFSISGSGQVLAPPPVLTIENAFRLLAFAATGVIAYADSRALRARGLHRTFGWGWSILATGVYVIGRSVIVRRQTGHGLWPIWVWITLMVIAVPISFLDMPL